MPGRGKRIVEMTLTELWTHLLVTLVISIVLFASTFPYQERWSWFIRVLCVFFWFGNLLTMYEIWTRMRNSRGGGA